MSGDSYFQKPGYWWLLTSSIERTLSTRGSAAGGGGWANAAVGLGSPCLCSELCSGIFAPRPLDSPLPLLRSFMVVFLCCWKARLPPVLRAQAGARHSPPPPNYTSATAPCSCPTQCPKGCQAGPGNPNLCNHSVQGDKNSTLINLKKYSEKLRAKVFPYIATICP